MTLSELDELWAHTPRSPLLFTSSLHNLNAHWLDGHNCGSLLVQQRSALWIFHVFLYEQTENKIQIWNHECEPGMYQGCKIIKYSYCCCAWCFSICLLDGLLWYLICRMTTYITDSGSGSTENVNLNTKFQFLAFWAPSASFHIFFRLCTGGGDLS